jgi:hypothetical protein
MRDGNIMKQSKPQIRVAAVLYGILVVALIALGSYHVTHGGGWRTGTTELGLAVFSLILAWRTRKIAREGRVGKHLRFRAFLLTIILAAVILFLIFSGYHFTHDGLRSGIIELISAGILITLGLITRILIR